MINLGHDLLFGAVAADAYAYALLKNNVEETKGISEARCYSITSAFTLCTANNLTDFPQNINRLLEMYAICLDKGNWITDGTQWDNLDPEFNRMLTEYRSTRHWKKTKTTREEIKFTTDLVRLLPVVFVGIDLDMEQRFRIIGNYVRPLTVNENNLRCITMLYQFIYDLMKFRSKDKAFHYFQNYCFNTFESGYDEFYALGCEDFIFREQSAIKNNQHIVSTLEMVLWAFMTTNSYAEAVEKVITFDGDIITNAALVGAIAGIYYGYETIPEEWISSLKNYNQIKELAVNFERRFHRVIEFPTYDPIKKLSKRKLFHLAKVTYGEEIEEFKKDFMDAEHLDAHSAEFKKYWYPIYCNLRFAYGVKHKLIVLNDDPITERNRFDFDFDPKDIIKNLASEIEPFKQSKKVYFENNSIQYYLDFV